MRLLGLQRCAVLLVLATCSPGAAQLQQQFWLLITTPSQWLVDNFQTGCEAEAKVFGITCMIYGSSIPNPQEYMARIESAIADGASGIVLEVDGNADDSLYIPSIRKAGEAGIGTVVVSTTLIEAASPYTDIALAIVGISAERFATEVAQAISSTQTDDRDFCVLSVENAPSSVSRSSSKVIEKLQAEGYTYSPSCPVASLKAGSFAETLFPVVENLLMAEDVKFVVLPFMTTSNELESMTEIARLQNRRTVFVSVWPSPTALSRAAISLLYRSGRGEQTERQLEIAPTIQISTDEYCRNCECSATQCKEACSKCRP